MRKGQGVLFLVEELRVSERERHLANLSGKWQLVWSI